MSCQRARRILNAVKIPQTAVGTFVCVDCCLQVVNIPNSNVSKGDQKDDHESAEFLGHLQSVCVIHLIPRFSAIGGPVDLTFYLRRR